MILSIITKQIKQSFRDKKSIAIMILFPVVLMIILGAAFSNYFDEKSVNLKTTVLYDSSHSNIVVRGFNFFRDSMKDFGIAFVEEKDEAKARIEVQKGLYACYVEINDNNIHIYKNDKFNDKANYVEGALRGFADTYNLIYEVSKEGLNPSAVIAEENKKNSYIEKITVDKKKSPRAIDYYAVTMTSLILLYASMSGFHSILNEKKSNTLNRSFTAPITKNSFLSSKLIGVFVVTCIQLFSVVFVSKVFLKANWGDNLLVVIFILLSEVVFSIGLGGAVAYFFDNENAGNGVLNAIIPIMAFLGGNYISIDKFGGILQKVANISPVKWVNTSILNIIYNNDYSDVFMSILINIVLAALLIAFASAANRRVEI